MADSPTVTLTPAQVVALELLVEMGNMCVNLTPDDTYRREPAAKAALAEVEAMLAANERRRRASVIR